MWDGINRRKFPRVNYKCIITIKTASEVPKILTARTENVGMGGIAVVLKESLSLFQRVELELLLENGQGPVRCGGSVVWVVKKSDPANKSAITYDIGIEFLNIKETDKNRIATIVEKIISS